MKGLAAVAATVLLASAAGATLSQRQLDMVAAAPPAGAVLPDARFAAADGRAVTLREVADGRPLVVVFADFTCRHICGPGLALTGGTLHDAKLVAGRDYRVALVGLDPRDPVAAGRAMVADQLAATPEVARATTVLRGSPASVASATAALGFRAVYDPATDQFAHEAVVYLFAPDGRLATMLPELGLAPAVLRAAILAPAPAATVAGGGGLLGAVAHLCYGFGAAQGRFARPIIWGLQGGAALLLVAGAWLFWRRRHAA